MKGVPDIHNLCADAADCQRNHLNCQRTESDEVSTNAKQRNDRHDFDSGVRSFAKDEKDPNRFEYSLEVLAHLTKLLDRAAHAS